VQATVEGQDRRRSFAWVNVVVWVVCIVAVVFAVVYRRDSAHYRSQRDRLATQLAVLRASDYGRGIPAAYLDQVGVHVPLTLAQVQRLQHNLSQIESDAKGDPADFAPIASVEFDYRPGDPLGSIRVTYTFACTGADMGYEEVELLASGRERIVQPTTGASDQTGQLCG
jgi:hypothetical protein